MVLVIPKLPKLLQGDSVGYHWVIERFARKMTSVRAGRQEWETVKVFKRRKVAVRGVQWKEMLWVTGETMERIRAKGRDKAVARRVWRGIVRREESLVVRVKRWDFGNW